MLSPPSSTARSALVDPTALCSCHTSSLSTPAGEIVVVRVFGDVDLSTEHVLRDTLTEARLRRPSHLVVDVAGMGFCSVRGLALLACPPPGPGTEYLLSGVAPHTGRHLCLLWPADALPVRYPSAGAAALAAMAQQRERRRCDPHTAPGRDRVPSPPRTVDAPDRLANLTDDELAERARDGAGGAYRELARRHRTRMYRGALRALGVSEDPDDVATDIATRLRTALAAVSEADPP